MQELILPLQQKVIQLTVIKCRVYNEKSKILWLNIVISTYLFILEQLFQNSRYPDLFIVVTAMNDCNQKQLLPLAVPSHPLYRIRRNYNDK